MQLGLIRKDDRHLWFCTKFLYSAGKHPAGRICKMAVLEPLSWWQVGPQLLTRPEVCGEQSCKSEVQIPQALYCPSKKPACHASHLHSWQGPLFTTEASFGLTKSHVLHWQVYSFVSALAIVSGRFQELLSWFGIRHEQFPSVCDASQFAGLWPSQLMSVFIPWLLSHLWGWAKWKSAIQSRWVTKDVLSFCF